MIRVIPGFSNYMCDENGQVYTIEHDTKRLSKPFKDGRPRSYQYMHVKGGPKKMTVNKRTGYVFCAAVNDDNKLVTLYAHRACWMAFNETEIPKGFEIDHKNVIVSDNNINNLQLVTRSANCKLAFTRRIKK